MRSERWAMHKGTKEYHRPPLPERGGSKESKLESKGTNQVYIARIHENGSSHRHAYQLVLRLPCGSRTTAHEQYHSYKLTKDSSTSCTSFCTNCQGTNIIIERLRRGNQLTCGLVVNRLVSQWEWGRESSDYSSSRESEVVGVLCSSVLLDLYHNISYKMLLPDEQLIIMYRTGIKSKTSHWLDESSWHVRSSRLHLVAFLEKSSLCHLLSIMAYGVQWPVVWCLVCSVVWVHSLHAFTFNRRTNVSSTHFKKTN
jgi:hypothetical protein